MLNHLFWQLYMSHGQGPINKNKNISLQISGKKALLIAATYGKACSVIFLWIGAFKFRAKIFFSSHPSKNKKLHSFS